MFPIVIVDDAREDLELAERVFREANIMNPVFALKSGAACLDFLTNHYSPDSETKVEAALVFMDVAMPVMNGVQTIAAINLGVYTQRPFIVMLSGQTDVKLVREGYQLGAKTFLTKPLKVQDIEDFLQSNEQQIQKVMRAEGYQLRWARA